MLENTTLNSSTENDGIALTAGTVPFPVVMLFTCGVIGNIIAIVLLIYTSKSHKWRSFYRLVLVLAVSDFAGLLGALPIVMSVYLNNKIWLGGQIRCDFLAFIFTFSGLVSGMVAATMTFDRFLAVQFPLVYNSLSSSRRTNCMIIGILILDCILSSLPLVGVNRNVNFFPGTWCFFNFFATESKDIFFSYLYASLVICMVFVMVILNTFVVVVLARRSKKKSTQTRISESEVNYVYNTVFLVVLMCVFTACWVPIAVRIIVNQSAWNDRDYSSDLMAARLALTNLVIDPWVYIVFRKDTVISVMNYGKHCISVCGFRDKSSNISMRERRLDNINESTVTCEIEYDP